MRCSHDPATRIAARSASTISWIWGRCTFTTTGGQGAPSGGRVAEPRPMHLADGRGGHGHRVEVEELRAPGACPNSASMTSRIASKLSAPTSSWSPASSAVISRGSTSRRDERNCPTLISTPPMRTASARNRTAIRTHPARPCASREITPRPIFGRIRSQKSSLSMTPVKKRIVRAETRSSHGDKV